MERKRVKFKGKEVKKFYIRESLAGVDKIDFSIYADVNWYDDEFVKDFPTRREAHDYLDKLKKGEEG